MNENYRQPKEFEHECDSCDTSYLVIFEENDEEDISVNYCPMCGDIIPESEMNEFVMSLDEIDDAEL
jgi:hypothetical protein